MTAIPGLVFSKEIIGRAHGSVKFDQKIEGGEPGRSPNAIGHLLECSCMPLNRLNPSGLAIREAYQTAVVTIIQNLYASPSNIVVAGSGGLLQEAYWLSEY